MIDSLWAPCREKLVRYGASFFSFRALAVGSAILTVSASPAAPQVSAAEGLGTLQCAQYAEAYDAKSDALREYAIWITGFLTAANAYEDDTFDLTPWQPIELSVGQIAQFCRANSDASVAQAVARYIQFLRPNRLEKQESPLSLRNGEKGVFIYPSVLAQVRQELIDRLFLPADAETEFGKQFGNAVLAFQRARGLSASGLPDTPTLLTLFQGN